MTAEALLVGAELPIGRGRATSAVFVFARIRHVKACGLLAVHARQIANAAVSGLRRWANCKP